MRTPSNDTQAHRTPRPWLRSAILALLVSALATLGATTTGIAYAQTPSQHDTTPHALEATTLTHDEPCTIGWGQSTNPIDENQIKPRTGPHDWAG